MMEILLGDKLTEVVAVGSTTIATAGTELPLCGVTYSAGTVTLTAGSRAVSSAGGANFSAAHATLAAAGVLFLKTAGAHVYKVASVDAAGEALTLVDPAVEAEAGVAYQLYRMYDCRFLSISAPSGNTNAVWVGDATIDYTAGNGISIPAGQSRLLPITGLVDLWVDTDANGNKIGWMFLK